MHRILKSDLKMSKASARWVPRLNTALQIVEWYFSNLVAILNFKSIQNKIGAVNGRFSIIFGHLI